MSHTRIVEARSLVATFFPSGLNTAALVEVGCGKFRAGREFSRLYSFTAESSQVTMRNLPSGETSTLQILPSNWGNVRETSFAFQSHSRSEPSSAPVMRVCP